MNLVVTHLKKHLTEMVDCIIEEHQAKTLLKPSYGIDASLFEELNQQTSFCQKAAQCSVNREKTISEIKRYTKHIIFTSLKQRTQIPRQFFTTFVSIVVQSTKQKVIVSKTLHKP